MMVRQSLPDSCIHKKLNAREIVELVAPDFRGFEGLSEDSARVPSRSELYRTSASLGFRAVQPFFQPAGIASA